LLGGSERFFHRYFLWSWWDFKRQRVAPSLARRWAECVTKHNWARNIKRDRLNIEVNDRWWWGGKENEDESFNKIYQALGNTKTFFFLLKWILPLFFSSFFFDIIDVRVRQDSVLCVSINKLRACEMEKEGDAGPFRSVRWAQWWKLGRVRQGPTTKANCFLLIFLRLLSI
jgi:hypothetical protein